jgi:hypothetical protein
MKNLEIVSKLINQTIKAFEFFKRFLNKKKFDNRSTLKHLPYIIKRIIKKLI